MTDVINSKFSVKLARLIKDNTKVKEKGNAGGEVSEQCVDDTGNECGYSLLIGRLSRMRLHEIR